MDKKQNPSGEVSHELSHHKFDSSQESDGQSFGEQIMQNENIGSSDLSPIVI